ncbi:MAG: SMI1/KNR4 family protein [Polyangiaceae bacterium]
MKKLWGRLESWMDANTGESLKLSPPATAAAVTKAEKALGVQFPTDFKESLMIHDGQKTVTISWLPAGAQLLSLKQIMNQWKMEKSFGSDDPDGFETFQCKKRVRSVAYHPQRVAIAYAEMATAGLYLDFVPGPKGEAGQLIYNHSEAEFAVLGDSFGDFLTRYVKLLEEGKLVYKADTSDQYEVAGFIVKKGGKLGSDFYKALAIA